MSSGVRASASSSPPSANAAIAVGPLSPIGVFDSGVGGLSVLREIRSLLPYEHVVYVADSAHAPYGDKPEEYVQRRDMTIARFLVENGAKALVLACNTATAGSVDALRAAHDVPIVAIEPGVKAAVAATRTGVIGVLVTTSTAASGRYASLLQRFGSEIEVVTVGAPGLVEHIERNDLDSPDIRGLAEVYLEPMLSAGSDVIVLGCTHYVFIRPLLASIAGPSVELLDTGAAVARQLKRVLAERHLLNHGAERGSEKFWSSAAGNGASEIMSRLYGSRIEAQALPDPFA
jgi:glutamate racemase